MKDLKLMSIEEIDKYINNLPYAWMKAIRYQEVKKIRADYIPKHIREKE